MGKDLEIHIVAFNVPYPPDYGGVIDIFYKIKTLHQLGVLIHLHCYAYGRSVSQELKKYCKSIQYYNRSKKPSNLFSLKPFIVKTRSNKNLLNILLRDSLPVLFEGLHTTHFLKKLLERPRQIIVRTHNIEHFYYRGLAKKEKNPLKKLFFVAEALKLKKFEKVLKENLKIAAISENDHMYFKNINPSSVLVPAFHPFNDVKVKAGAGNFILYHGDLSVNENLEVVLYIVQEIYPKVDFKFKIAGRNPDKKVKKAIANLPDIELIANPTNEELSNMVQNAQINLMFSFQNTGFKLKLINCLFNGRHCIVNNQMVDGTQLEKLCIIRNTTKDIVNEIKSRLNSPIDLSEINKRKQILLKNVNNARNGQNLINLLY